MLESPLLPARLEDDQIKDAMRALSQPHSPFFHQMMEELFAPSRVHLPSAELVGRASTPRRYSSVMPGEGVVAGGLNTALCSRLLLQGSDVMLGLSRTQDRIASALRRHNAMPLMLPPLWVKQSAHPANDETAFVLDRSGALLGLHAGGRAPLLPYLACHPPLAQFKRYSFAHALRGHSARGGSSGLPKEQLLADFDIVLPPGTSIDSGGLIGGGSAVELAERASLAASAAAAVEAELLRACHDVLAEVGVPLGGVGGALLQIAHPHLNAALLSLCGAPPVGEASRHHLVAALTRAASRSLDDADWAAAMARVEKRELCTKDCADKMLKYLVAPRGVRATEHLRKLRTLIVGRAAAADADKGHAVRQNSTPHAAEAVAKAAAAERAAALSALDALDACFSAAAALGVPASLLQLEPRLTLPLDEFPTGIHVQVLQPAHDAPPLSFTALSDPRPSHPSQVVQPGHDALVRGGRWDGLAWGHGLGERCCGGLSIYVSKLYAAGAEAAKGEAARGAAPDVLVCSVGAGLAHARLKVVGELWQAGVQAEATLGNEPELGSQMEQAELMQVPHVLVLRSPEEDGGSSSAGGREAAVRATLHHLRSHREFEDAPTSGAELAKLLQATKGAGAPRRGKSMA